MVSAQQPARGQVFDQRTHRLVDLGQLLLQAREAVLVQVPAAEIHFHERHARLHQPPRHQAATAKVGVAVAFA